MNQFLERRFKKHLKELVRTRVGVHPDPSKNLFLHRNERTIPYDGETFRRLKEHLSKVDIHLYPDIELFYEKLARWLGVSDEELYLTEGVSGAAKALIETLAGPGDNIVFPTPTFALYPVYCRMFDLEYRTVGYSQDRRLDINRMYELVDEKTAVVFLPNPNVPIEGVVDLREIEKLAGYCAKHGAFLAIDEVYYPFGGPTAKGLINGCENLFIMQSFSKAFGLAGIRLGYILGNRNNIQYVSKTRTGYETNSLSVATASFFMDNYRLVERYIADVKSGISYLKCEFNRLGLRHRGGDASNFIYVELRDGQTAGRLADMLKKKNIYIRAGWPEPFEAGFSVTAGPTAIMKCFVRELEEALKIVSLYA